MSNETDKATPADIADWAISTGRVPESCRAEIAGTGDGLVEACEYGRHGGLDDDILLIVAESLRTRADATDRDYDGLLASPDVWRDWADQLEHKARLQTAALAQVQQ